VETQAGTPVVDYSNPIYLALPAILALSQDACWQPRRIQYKNNRQTAFCSLPELNRKTSSATAQKSGTSSIPASLRPRGGSSGSTSRRTVRKSGRVCPIRSHTGCAIRPRRASPVVP